jgi:membrane-bound acyltransferase YfiQ involved in biofilm formation
VYPLRKDRVINEVFWIRAFACLAVVAIHTVYNTLENYEGIISKPDEYFLIAVRFAALFGTPAFIFISELLLARVYPDDLPKGFFVKRIKYLLFPFIFMGIIFALITNNTLEEIGAGILLNVFAGNYTGYFILVIFQFYILHYLFHKYLKRWNPVLTLAISLAINIIYLSVFNFFEPPQNMIGNYFWERGHWILFVGWIFYFVLGYYCGVHYHYIKRKIVQFKWIIIFFPLISIFVMVFLVRMDILTVVSSKRIDNIFYTIGVISLIVLFTHRLKNIPWPVLFISKYSFHIYLLHKVFLYYFPVMNDLSPLLYFGVSFVYAVGASVLFSYIVSSFSWTSFFIGKKLAVPNKMSA